VFTITGKGFPSSQKLNFISQSCDENVPSYVETNEEGSFLVLYSPAVIGKTTGPFKVQVQGKSSKALSLKHYWGSIAFTLVEKYDDQSSIYTQTH